MSSTSFPLTFALSKVGKLTFDMARVVLVGAGMPLSIGSSSSSAASRQVQIPGSNYINESGTFQAQVPGGEYANEGGA